MKSSWTSLINILVIYELLLLLPISIYIQHDHLVPLSLCGWESFAFSNYQIHCLHVSMILLYLCVRRNLWTSLVLLRFQSFLFLYMHWRRVIYRFWLSREYMVVLWRRKHMLRCYPSGVLIAPVMGYELGWRLPSAVASVGIFFRVKWVWGDHILPRLLYMIGSCVELKQLTVVYISVIIFHRGLSNASF